MHFARIGNDPKRAKNIMGIVGAFLGNGALVTISYCRGQNFACAGIRMTNRRYVPMDRDSTHDQAKGSASPPLCLTSLALFDNPFAYGRACPIQSHG